jgi:hypothetical protein
MAEPTITYRCRHCRLRTTEPTVHVHAGSVFALRPAGTDTAEPNSGDAVAYPATYRVLERMRTEGIGYGSPAGRAILAGIVSPAP